MSAQGQQFPTGGSDATPGVGLSTSSLSVPVAPPLEPQYRPPLCPIIVKLPGTVSGESIGTGDALMHNFSPRRMLQNMVQPVRAFQQTAVHSGGGDQSGSHQYEDFAGILGDRLMSGGISDASISASSDKPQFVSSGSSSLGEHSGPRLKLMCSFGGKIVPRPGDGKLRYVGGDTRIVSINRHTNYINLMRKMRQVYGRGVLLKYQLPNEDLDALISVSSDEDVENMIEEYEKLEACDTYSRLRIFLFLPAEYEVNQLNDVVDSNHTDQWYVEAINGIPESRLVKHIDIVTVSCSNTLTGVGTSDTWTAPRSVKNVCVALPVAPAPQGTATCIIKSTPAGMPAANKQMMSRVSSATSVPSSPTVLSQPFQTRQGAVSDITFQLYPDQLAKAPIGHLQEAQCFDVGYQENEGAGSASSSLSSQHDGPYQPFESKRMMDLSLFAQQEVTSSEPPCQPDQLHMAEMPSINPYLRVPRVRSHNNLMPLQHQQTEVEALTAAIDRPLEHRFPDVPYPHLDVQQAYTLQQEVSSPQVSGQHPSEVRSQSYQRLDLVHLASSEKAHAYQPSSHQHAISHYYLPVTSNDLPPDKSFEQSMPIAYRPIAVQPISSTYGNETGLVSTMSPGSAPTSPRVVFQESKIDECILQQYFPGLRGAIGGHIGQLSHARTSVQPHSELANSVLKHSNFQGEPHDQCLNVMDGPIQQHPLVTMLKMDRLSQTSSPCLKCEGGSLPGCLSDTLIRPLTPARTGTNLNQDQATVPTDLDFANRSDQEHVHQLEDGFSVQSQYQPIDWAWERTQHENTVTGWTQVSHIETRGDPGIGGNNGGPFVRAGGVRLNVSNASLYSTATSNPHDQLNPSMTHRMASAAVTRPTSGETGFLDSSQSIWFRNPEADDLSTQVVQVGSRDVSAVSSNIDETPGLDVLSVTSNQKLDDKAYTELLLPRRLLPTTLPSASRSDSTLTVSIEESKWVRGFDKPEAKDDTARNLGKDASDITPSLDSGTSRAASSRASAVCDYNAPSLDTASEKVWKKSLIDADTSFSTLQASVSTCMCYPGQRDPLALGLESLSSVVTSASCISACAVGSSSIVSPTVSVNLEVATASTSSHLAEFVNQSIHNNVVPFQLKEDREKSHIKAESVYSEKTLQPNAPATVLEGLTQGVNVTDLRGDFPKFDSDTLVGSMGVNDQTVQNTDDQLTLYPAPTLSIQNWEESLVSAKLEHKSVEVDFSAKDCSSDMILHSIEKRVAELEIAIEEVSADDPVVDKSLSPAALAEAEAITRGLQTIKNSDLEELRELGTGTFGTVYHGKWRGTDVAIKRIKSSCFTGRPSERERLLCDFWREAYILGQLHHPNVVAFYGVVPDGPGGTLATVTEYMVNGSLKQVLHKKDRTIDRRKRLLIIMDAAFGMEYLHGKNIVHFDLKCENLLVNMKDPQRPICKVGDLGLSKVKHQTMVSGGVRGTLPWMAPELLNGSSSLVCEKVDVFSFGIVMWELLTGEEPYANMHYGAIIGGIVNNTLRPLVPSWCEPSWKSLMERCWSSNPAERPTFLEIAAELRSMANVRPQGQQQAQAAGCI